MAVRPDDIPEWAWDEAAEFASDIETTSGYGIYGGAVDYQSAMVAVSKAILKAQKDAYEECAKIIEDDLYTDQDIEDEPTDFRAQYNRALKRQEGRIRQAIRNKASEIK